MNNRILEQQAHKDKITSTFNSRMIKLSIDTTGM